MLGTPVPNGSTAVNLGEIVIECYGMYHRQPNSLNPDVPEKISQKYYVADYVIFKDYIKPFAGTYQFFGLLLSLKSQPWQFVLALRGTDNIEDAYTDFLSMYLIDWVGPGKVGDGFYNTYTTLRLLGTPAEEPGSSEMSFAEQVEAACNRHLENLGILPPDQPTNVDVVGHSLGAALATLYVADNMTKNRLKSAFLCTFGSPRVGDPTFAKWFNNLPVNSWRVANINDLVTLVPSDGFEHINNLYQYYPGPHVKIGLICYHSMFTYLHVIDNKQRLLPECNKIIPMQASPALGGAAHQRDVSISSPTSGESVVINININLK